jgi:sialidase-1
LKTGGLMDGIGDPATLKAVMIIKRWIWLGWIGVACAGESFENHPAAGFQRLESPLGEWSAAEGQAEIHTGHAKEGRQSLRLTGGGSQELELKLATALNKPGRLSFWAERWTSRGPFVFRIDAASAAGEFKEVWNGDKEIKVGDFLTRVEVRLQEGTARLRFRCEAPAKTGVMMDLLELQDEKPMRLLEVDLLQPVVPVLRGKAVNPVLGLRIATEGSLDPLALEAVEVSLNGTDRPGDVATISLLPGKADPSGGFGEAFGGTVNASNGVFSGKTALSAGDNWWWLSVQLKNDAAIDGRVDAKVTRVKVSGRTIDMKETSPPGAQRIGVALRQHGDDGSKAYRIPGMVRTNKGTLIAVYDIRYRGSGDLPGDIDVGMSRSTNGGVTWEPMRRIMDMGNDPKWGYDGVGDPSVLVDRSNNRIWVAGTWSHGNRSWNGSGKGMKPTETGQFMLVSSNDDGMTWSEPVNITGQVKNPDWHFLLQGPGSGITMKDGTLVFPAQFRAEDAARTPYSTLIFSKDHGKTWSCGTGVKSNTTEAQLVELEGGEIMINCRDNRGGARTVATTRDLGQTWQLHPTDRKALPESVCMASLLKWDVPGVGERLFFSNPATTRGRHSMTVKVSEDRGMTWLEPLHTLYDIRIGAGYSSLAPASERHLGILYEGPSEIYFLRIPVAELLGTKPLAKP